MEDPTDVADVTGGGNLDQPHEDQTRGELADLVGSLELPIAVVALDDFRLLAVSRSALRHIAVPPTSVIGRPVFELFQVTDRDKVISALGAMRAGVIDFYRAHRQLDPTAISNDLVTEWVRAIEWDRRRVALVEIAFGSGPQADPLVDYLGREPVVMAVGMMEATWVITSLSSDITELVGPSGDVAVGKRLIDALDSSEARRLLDADRWADCAISVARGIHLRNSVGGSTRVCCVVTSMAGGDDRCFMLIADPERPGDRSADRAAQLEAHLLRIAAEVDAAGLLRHVGATPDLARFPQLRDLTTRQWEVLHHLLSGERVPTIAADMFVSQSTVRNHLAAIFQRFGVHSQAELLALLSHSGRTA